MKAPLAVKAAGRTFGLTMTPEEAAALLDLSEQAVRAQCRQGVLPTLPRKERRGHSWRISTLRLLDALGVPYTVVAA